MSENPYEGNSLPEEIKLPNPDLMYPEYPPNRHSRIIRNDLLDSPPPLDSWLGYRTSDGSTQLELIGSALSTPTYQFNPAVESKQLVISMYQEALDKKLFFLNNNSCEIQPTEEDRKYLLAYLEFFGTSSGILSIDEILQMRSGVDISDFRLKGIRTDIENVNVRINEAHLHHKSVGLFHGSFDPLHRLHLMNMLFYRQYCDYLIIGIDNDEFIKKYKVPTRDPNRPHYDKIHRILVLLQFEHLFEDILYLPITELKNYHFTDVYRYLGVDKVFVHHHDPHLENRRKSIEDAKKECFLYSPIPYGVISSSNFWEYNWLNPKNTEYPTPLYNTLL